MHTAVLNVMTSTRPYTAYAAAIAASKPQCLHLSRSRFRKMSISPEAALGMLRPSAQLRSIRGAARAAGRARPRARVCSAAAAGGEEMTELQRIQANDQLLDILLNCNSQEKLASAVADNVLSFDQKFWLRLATRADTAPDKETKEKLGRMATVIMKIVEEMVKTSEGRLEKSSNVLQEILIAAADENGEWVVPLPQPQLDALEKAIDEKEDQIDEAVLSNAFAWMRKASDDKLDGMVALLQKVLQLYAAKQLMEPNATAREDIFLNEHMSLCLEKLLSTQEEQWESFLRKSVEASEVSEVSFSEALQRRMEGAVLSLKSGSYTQRIQAEFLKELEGRVAAVFKSI